MGYLLTNHRSDGRGPAIVAVMLGRWPKSGQLRCSDCGFEAMSPFVLGAISCLERHSIFPGHGLPLRPFGLMPRAAGMVESDWDW